MIISTTSNETSSRGMMRDGARGGGEIGLEQVVADTILETTMQEGKNRVGTVSEGSYEAS